MPYRYCGSLCKRLPRFPDVVEASERIEILIQEGSYPPNVVNSIRCTCSSSKRDSPMPYASFRYPRSTGPQASFGYYNVRQGATGRRSVGRRKTMATSRYAKARFPNGGYGSYRTAGTKRANRGNSGIRARAGNQVTMKVFDIHVSPSVVLTY